MGVCNTSEASNADADRIEEVKIPVLSRGQAYLLVCGYCRINITNDVSAICVDYYLHPMPEFITHNCSINYKSGIIESMPMRDYNEYAYIVLKNPWKYGNKFKDDHGMLHFKLEFLTSVNWFKHGLLNNQRWQELNAKIEGREILQCSGPDDRTEFCGSYGYKKEHIRNPSLVVAMDTRIQQMGLFRWREDCRKCNGCNADENREDEKRMSVVIMWNHINHKKSALIQYSHSEDYENKYKDMNHFVGCDIPTIFM